MVIPLPPHNRSALCLTAGLAILLAALCPTAFGKEIVNAAYESEESGKTGKLIEKVSFEAPLAPITINASEASTAPTPTQEEQLFHWSAEIESTYLQPSINGNDIRVVNDGLFASPRILLSTQQEVYNLNIRFWQMETDEETAGFYYNSVNREALEAFTVDLEVARQIEVPPGEHRLALGLRTAQLIKENDFKSSGSFLGSMFTENQNTIVGSGITTGVSGRIPLLKPQHKAYFVYHLQSSLLIGINHRDNEQIFGQELIPGALNRPLNGRRTSTGTSDYDFETLLITEARLGIEVKYQLFDSKNDATLKIMFESQKWATEEGITSGIAYTAPYFGIAKDPALNLVGLSVSTSFTW